MFWFKRKPAPERHHEFETPRRTGIALGSNIGDRIVNLDAARTALMQLPSVSEPLLVSRVFISDPVGTEPDARPFLNAVIEIDYNGKPDTLLAALKEIEVARGRPSRHPPNTSRTLDMDILYMGDLVLHHEDLCLPHPRLHRRRFVLTPLNDIRPELILPDQQAPISELLEMLDDPTSVKLFASKW